MRGRHSLMVEAAFLVAILIAAWTFLAGCAQAAKPGVVGQDQVSVEQEVQEAIVALKADLDAQIGQRIGRDLSQNFDPWTMRGMVGVAALPSLLLVWYMRGRLQAARLNGGRG